MGDYRVILCRGITRNLSDGAFGVRHGSRRLARK